MILFFPILISVISLGVSLYVAYRAWRFNELSKRRASRESHAKMVFDIGRMLVDSPELWSIYDTHALAKDRDESPLAAAKREAFIHQHFNVFEMVRDYYTNVIHRDRVDDEYWQSWDLYIREFFTTSSDARMLFKEPETQEIYSKTFVAYVNQIINIMSGTP